MKFSLRKKNDGLDAVWSTKNTETQQAETPYLAARRTFNDQSAANRANRQMWQLVGILSLLIALTSVGGAIHIGSQSKFVPYVIEVSKLGEPLAVAPAQRAARVDTRVVHAAVASFISDMRLVTSDVSLQSKAIWRAYAMLSSKDAATQKANDWLNASADVNPFKRAEKETVSTEITSVIPQTPDTWQVDWVETTRDRQGVVTAKANMRALVTIYVAEPTSATTEAQIRNNPLGLFVKDFSWAKQV